jgi:hypothetical protein
MQNDEGEQQDLTFFSYSIQSVKNLMKSRIFGNPNDELGLVFYSTVRPFSNTHTHSLSHSHSHARAHTHTHAVPLAPTQAKAKNEVENGFQRENVYVFFSLDQPDAGRIRDLEALTGM